MLQKTQHLYTFGPFTVNAADCVLACNGREIKLESKAFDLLVFFILHSGELVNREQIKLAVWGEDVNIIDNNIDKKIGLIRDALSQHDGTRKYIQNRPGRGWRFTAEVTEHAEEPLPEPPVVVPLEQLAPALSHQVFGGKAYYPWLFAIAALALTPIAVAVMLGGKKSAQANFEPQTIDYRRLTTDGRPKNGPLASDGSYVYFSERRGQGEDGPASVAAVPIGGGNVLFPPNPVQPAALILGIAHNTQDVLYGPRDTEASSMVYVWRRKPRLLERAAQTGLASRISPDGRSIAYPTGMGQTSALIIRDLGARPNIRRIAVNGDLSAPAWSPDGSHIRFPVTDPVSETSVFWEARRDGSHLRRLPFVSRPRSPWSTGCWTADGRYFIYSEASVTAASSSLWIESENSASGQGQHVQLTNNLMNFDLPAPAAHGNTIFARGSLPKYQVDRYDASRGEFTPFWEGVPAVDVSFSKDGAWAAYRNPSDDILWISRSGGSERRQLTQPPLRAYQPHWSPDGGRIAFMGQALNQPSQIFIVGASGGQPKALKPGDSLDQGVPSWSGEGRYLAFGELRGRRSDADMLIRLLDLKTGKESILPGSKAKWTPRWSPDGRYIVAVATDSSSLALFDCAGLRWARLATARGIDDPAWSSDSRFVHFNAETGANGGRELFRVRIADGVVERLAPLPHSQIRWSGVSPDGSPLVLNSRRIEDIYAIDFKLQ